jgi:endonuclease YncB( thermonuclease family)
VEVTDGDTVVVQVRILASVRLKDCWAKELREGGQPAKNRLIELAKGKDATLCVDLSGTRRLGDVFTFGRVVGTLWIDDLNVNRQMVDEGLATETKQ